jgi:ribonuclease T1
MIQIMPRESFEMIAKRAVLRALPMIFLLIGSSLPAIPALADPVDDFAARIGIEHVSEFHRTVTSLRDAGHLPGDLYVTKREAFSLGWHPGADICPWLGGRMIGGDRFDNREHALPPGAAYHEADLDEEDCGHRGARRLIFDDSGDVWVSLDHYRSFRKVP